MQLIITEIFCNKSSGPTPDDFFMFIQADGLPPTRYPPIGFKLGQSGHAVKLPAQPASPTDGIVVGFDDGVCATAFDRDFKVVTGILNDNDFLFSFSVASNSGSGGETTTSNHNGSSYTIKYQITS